MTTAIFFACNLRTTFHSNVNYPDLEVNFICLQSYTFLTLDLKTCHAKTVELQEEKKNTSGEFIYSNSNNTLRCARQGFRHSSTDCNCDDFPS